MAPFVTEDNERWSIGGSTSVEDNLVRLTSSQPHNIGMLFGRKPSTLTDWEVVLELSLGPGGGDGLAFWFTAQQPQLGPVYGNTDFFNGLGVMVDTSGPSPVISGYYNDGSQPYLQSMQLGSLTISLPWSRLYLRVTYLNKVLAVDTSVTEQGTPQFSPCFVAVVDLGLDKFFGVTAANGRGNAAFDVLRVETHSLATKSEEMEKARRDSYTRETEINHEQNQNYLKTLPTAEFRHHVLTSLNQMQGALASMEVIQAQMGQLLAQGATLDEHRMHFDRVAGGTVDAELVKAQIAKVAAVQHRILRDLEAVASAGGDDNAQIVRSKQRQISNLLMSLQSEQVQGGGSSNNANPSANGEFESLASQQSWDFFSSARAPVVVGPSQSRLIPLVLTIAVACTTISLVRAVMSSPKNTASTFSHY